MSKWKCDICKSEFDNFHAEGFEKKIYCPLCYYKHEFNRLQQEKEELIKYCEDKIKTNQVIYEKEKAKGNMLAPMANIQTPIYEEILSKLKESDKND